MPVYDKARVSKYPIIKQTLKSRLLTGLYRPGQAIPSETQLAKEFTVSRMTARRALDELEREGLIYRVQGSGSFPTGQRFQQGVFRIQSLEEMSLAVNLQAVPFTRVLRSGLQRADAETAHALRLELGAAVLEVVRLRGIDSQPVLLERRFLRSEAEVLLGKNLAVESIHELLVGDLQLEISNVEQSLEAVNLESEEANLLELPVGAACFLMRRTSFTQDVPFSFASYWVRSDRGAFISAFVS
jgi:DNA-binding GntR family transcriptional regulator